MTPQTRIQALQYVFDADAPEEDRKLIQHEINQCVANGFIILASPTVGNKIYYQLAAQLAPGEEGVKKK